MRKLWMPVLMIAVLAGCNTMLQRTYQNITVHTPGVENVECAVETKKNRWRLIAPGKVLVDRSRWPLKFTCEKANYKTAVVTIESHVRMAGSQLNIFNGFIPGTTYDVASNSIYDYPDTVIIDMKPVPNPARLDPRRITTIREKGDSSMPSVTAPVQDEKIDKMFSKSLKK